MTPVGLRAQLEELLDLILRERECAKAFEMDELHAVTARKEELLMGLESVDEAGPEMRELAERVREENRRNAYLFWSTLKFIRDSVGFFNRQVTQTSYGAAGGMINSGDSGMLLSGRI